MAADGFRCDSLLLQLPPLLLAVHRPAARPLEEPTRTSPDPDQQDQDFTLGWTHFICFIPISERMSWAGGSPCWTNTVPAPVLTLNMIQQMRGGRKWADCLFNSHLQLWKLS